MQICKGKVVLAVFATFFVTAMNAEQIPIQVNDYFSLEIISDPQISPSGNHIAYVREYSDILTDSRYSNLWVVDFDGSNHRAVTNGKTHDQKPGWSPSGEMLAYVSDRSGSSEIYVRWMEGGSEIQLTQLGGLPILAFNWSPDGRSIAFTSLVPSAPANYAKMPEPPPGATWKKPPTTITQGTYRFDGVGVVPDGHVHIFVVSLESLETVQITKGDFDFGGPRSGGGGPPTWTPDGRKLIFSTIMSSKPFLTPDDNEIYSVDLETQEVVQLTNRRGQDRMPVVSPDGTKLAYLGSDKTGKWYDTEHLYIMDLAKNSSGVFVTDYAPIFAESAKPDITQIQWDAKSKGLYVLFDQEGISKLGYAPLGQRLEEIATNIGGSGTAYQFGAAFSVASDGRYVINQVSNSEVGILATGSGMSEPKKIVSLNDSLLQSRDLGEVQEIWFKSSKDGQRIQGWYVLPPAFERGKRYPLILEIHGGPQNNYGPRFDFSKQLYAANGYVVLYVNERGSTSYGADFVNLIDKAFPGDDYYDLMSAVDELVDMGFINEDQLFVTGGSAGGTLSAWIVSKTNRFRAAVIKFPVINWVSLSLTTDIFPSAMTTWFPGPPWEHMEHYSKLSPISYAANIKTPSMIITGVNDLRTPLAESEQLYTALTWLGVETALVTVPDESHGIYEHPSHYLSQFLNAIGWFEAHSETQ